MGPLAMGILTLALAGAFISWGVAAVYGLRTLAAAHERPARLHWLSVVAWPFAVGRLKGDAGANAAVVNKAIVAFIVCITLAAATISLSTNFNRITK
jgi:hypothetical protein